MTLHARFGIIICRGGPTCPWWSSPQGNTPSGHLMLFVLVLIIQLDVSLTFERS